MLMLFTELELRDLRIKKTISIQQDVLEKGQHRANEFFSGNFSLYITYLINSDVKGVMINSGIHSTNQLYSTSPTNDYKHKKEVSNAIDSILNME